MTKNSSSYDVCIVGAGPAGLACLSAIREPYSIDNLTESQVKRAVDSIKLHRQLSVCVIDPNPNWMCGWKSNFEQLNIQHLRSPAMAHPNTFDTNALLAFACQQGRDKTDLIESGCFEIKKLLGLGQTQIGLWKLPSTKLFLDFCDDMAKNLEHTYLQGNVMDLTQNPKDESYRLEWADPKTGAKQSLCARNVIMAMGTTGRPMVPRGLVDCPTVAWHSPDAFSTNRSDSSEPNKASPQTKKRVLVVGGGLTAVQTALRIVDNDDKATCVLCSRRPLSEKHFDIPVEWFDRRTTNKCLSEFYHDTVDSRLNQLKEARDGGSVPPMYMRRLEKHKDRLTCWVGDVKYCDKEQEDDTPQTGKSGDGVTILYQGSSHKFDKVVLACGVTPDCTVNPLVKRIQEQWPITIRGGLPDVTEDLRWYSEEATGKQNIFVVGGMAALQVGPDAGNVMGIRRAALVIADYLDCKCWLHEKALANPFEALFLDDSDSDTESESEDDCSTCCENDTKATLDVDLQVSSCRAGSS